MNTYKKVFNIIKNILFYSLVVILLSVIVISLLNRKKPVPIFGYYSFTVLSGSMQDALHVGDNIIVKKTNSFKVGDIITYKKDNFYVTHRVVKINGDLVTTRGDANKTDDPPFNKNKVLGKFVYKSALINFIFKNKINLILILCILYVIDLIITTYKNKNKEEGE